MSVPDPVPPDPAPSNGNGRKMPQTPIWVIVLALAALGYYFAFGLSVPDVFDEKKSGGATEAEVTTWPACMRHRGYRATLTRELLLCNDGAIVTVR